MNNRPAINRIGFKVLHFLFVLTLFFACSEEEEPFTACISYDESVRYAKGVNIKLTSCSEGAVAYEWQIEDSVYTEKEVEHMIYKAVDELNISLRITDSKGNGAYENVRIKIRDTPVKTHTFDYSVYGFSHIAVKDNNVFVKGYYSDNKGSFGAYFDMNGNFKEVQNYNGVTIPFPLHREIHPTSEGFLSASLEWTERIVSEEGNYMYELVIPKFDEWGKYQSRTLTLTPIVSGVRVVKKADGYCVASGYVQGSINLTLLDENGKIQETKEIGSNITDNAGLVNFVKNEQGGYCAILRDFDSKKYIGIMINDQGVKEDEYLLPVTSISSSDLKFYADGTTLIVVNSSDSEVTVLNKSSLDATFHTELNKVENIVDGGDSKYLLIDDSGNISLINTGGVEYTVQYSLGDMAGVVSMNDTHYLIGRADFEEDYKQEVFILRVGLDGLVK